MTSSVLEIACHVFVTTVPMTNNCVSQICDICPVRVKSSWVVLCQCKMNWEHKVCKICWSQRPRQGYSIYMLCTCKTDMGWECPTVTWLHCDMEVNGRTRISTTVRVELLEECLVKMASWHCIYQQHSHSWPCMSKPALACLHFMHVLYNEQKRCPKANWKIGHLKLILVWIVMDQKFSDSIPYFKNMLIIYTYKGAMGTICRDGSN